MKSIKIHVPQVLSRPVNAIERVRCKHCLRAMLSSPDGVTRWCTCSGSAAAASAKGAGR